MRKALRKFPAPRKGSAESSHRSGQEVSGTVREDGPVPPPNPRAGWERRLRPELLHSTLRLTRPRQLCAQMEMRCLPNSGDHQETGCDHTPPAWTRGFRLAGAGPANSLVILLPWGVSETPHEKPSLAMGWLPAEPLGLPCRGESCQWVGIVAWGEGYRAQRPGPTANQSKECSRDIC